MMHVNTESLMESIKAALQEVGYAKDVIEIKGDKKYSLYSPGAPSARGFTCVVDLKSGNYKIGYGSWGGESNYNPANSIDSSRSQHDLDKKLAIIKGSEGAERPVFATVTINKDLYDSLPKPKVADVTEQEEKALKILSRLKKSYREEEFGKQGLGVLVTENPVIKSLLGKHLIKLTKAGNILLTTEGKNAI